MKSSMTGNHRPDTKAVHIQDRLYSTRNRIETLERGIQSAMKSGNHMKAALLADKQFQKCQEYRELRDLAITEIEENRI